MAPQVFLIGELFTTSAIKPHFLLFGGLSVMAAILVLQLPETANLMLPQTFDDIK